MNIEGGIFIIKPDNKPNSYFIIIQSVNESSAKFIIIQGITHGMINLTRFNIAFRDSP